MEQRALARRALDTDAAAHQFDVLPRDGQPQARALLLAGIAHLHERLEDAALVFLLDADAGILHFQHQMRSGVLSGGQAHDDLAVLGELDGVTDQVQQYLAQTRFITLDIAREFRGLVDF